MKRRLRIAMSCVLAICLLGGPVAAHDFTGSEEKKSGKKTTHTNDVKCGSGQAADAGGVKVYRSQTGTTSGGLGVCNDGTGPLGGAVPVQGRAVAQGSQNGGSVYIDGDKNNQPAPMQGWARLDGSTGGVKARCGDEKGNRDATHSDARDGQDDCG